MPALVSTGRFFVPGQLRPEMRERQMQVFEAQPSQGSLPEGGHAGGQFRRTCDRLRSGVNSGNSPTIVDLAKESLLYGQIPPKRLGVTTSLFVSLRRMRKQQIKSLLKSRMVVIGVHRCSSQHGRQDVVPEIVLALLP